MVILILKNYLQSSNTTERPTDTKKKQVVSRGISLGILWDLAQEFSTYGAASINVLRKLLPFMLEFKAQVKEAVRCCQVKDVLGLQTGVICCALRHLLNGGVH